MRTKPALKLCAAARIGSTPMKRFSKQWMAVASVVVVAVAVLIVPALTEHKPVPQFRFLGNHVPVIHEVGNGFADPATVYDYELEASFNSVVEQAAQELPRNGFSLAVGTPQSDAVNTLLSEDGKWVEYLRADGMEIISITTTEATSPGCHCWLVQQCRKAIGAAAGYCSGSVGTG